MIINSNGVNVTDIKEEYIKEVVVIDTSQIWTVPEGVHEIDVYAIGGGGAGGGTSGAGGGGGFAVFKHLFVSPKDTFDIVIGAGGVPHTSTGGQGNMGGATTFGDVIIAFGGLGGMTGAASSGGVYGGAGGAGGGMGSRYGSSARDNGGNGGSGRTGGDCIHPDYPSAGTFAPTNVFFKYNNNSPSFCTGMGTKTLGNGETTGYCPINGEVYGGGGGGGAYSTGYTAGFGGEGGGGNGSNNGVGEDGSKFGAGGGGGSNDCHGGKGHAGAVIIGYTIHKIY